MCPLPPSPSPHAKDCEGATAQIQASDLSWGVETYGVISYKGGVAY